MEKFNMMIVFYENELEYWNQMLVDFPEHKYTIEWQIRSLSDALERERN